MSSPYALVWRFFYSGSQTTLTGGLLPQKSAPPSSKSLLLHWLSSIQASQCRYGGTRGKVLPSLERWKTQIDFQLALRPSPLLITYSHLPPPLASFNHLHIRYQHSLRSLLRPSGRSNRSGQTLVSLVAALPPECVKH